MDSAGHYRSLIALGRDEFLATAAPAALVRHRGGDELDEDGATTLTIEANVDETVPMLKDDPAPAAQLEVYPLVKKPGASFPDRITIGRTPNNDVVINEHSVSRLHAYVRKDPKGWVVADAGSKNGSWLRGKALEARQERALTSNALLRFGEVTLTFYLAAELFDALGGES